MEQCVLTIGTVTGAIHARKLLAGARIGARLVKKTSSGRDGCAYGLEIYAADMPVAMRILGDNGIPFVWSRERAGR